MIMYISINPQLSDRYIDCSLVYLQVANEAIGMNRDAFNFDVRSTRLESNDTTINYQGNETHVLMVLVLLDNKQLDDLIHNLLVQQRANFSAISRESLDEIKSAYEDMELESAEYTLYIDDDNNLIRYCLNAEFSLDILGQDAQYNIQMQYDIIDTGDDVILDLPDIQPENSVNYETLLLLNALS